MKNKVCGECKNFQVVCDFVKPSTNATECDGFENKARTNGDKIRQMSNEELAKYIDCICLIIDCPHTMDDVSCTQCKKQWLESEVEE